ncbi:MAG: hypothetical protein ACYC3G_00040 [Minisyncoccota bacterium]
MFRIILIVLVNMLLGAALSMLVIRLPEQTLLLLGVGFLLATVLSAWIMLSKKEEIKLAEKEIKEREVWQVLSCFAAREAGANGVIAIVRHSKTLELKMFIFKKEPPPIFMKEDGEIVPYK